MYYVSELHEGVGAQLPGFGETCGNNSLNLPLGFAKAILVNEMTTIFPLVFEEFTLLLV